MNTATPTLERPEALRVVLVHDLYVTGPAQTVERIAEHLDDDHTPLTFERILSDRFAVGGDTNRKRWRTFHWGCDDDLEHVTFSAKHSGDGNKLTVGYTFVTEQHPHQGLLDQLASMGPGVDVTLRTATTIRTGRLGKENVRTGRSGRPNRTPDSANGKDLARQAIMDNDATELLLLLAHTNETTRTFAALCALLIPAATDPTEIVDLVAAVVERNNKRGDGDELVETVRSLAPDWHQPADDLILAAETILKAGRR